MRMTKLAFQNFKSSFRSYLSLIVSLAFTICIFFNFQNMIYSDTFAALGKWNKDIIEMLIQTVSFVLVFFMFFFIWYATNVFLTKRKREIGIYVFMGLTNQRIGMLYTIETVFIGFSALFLGLFAGIVTMWLFQMIVLAVSELAVDIQFRFQIQPVLIAAVVYLIIYLIFVVKGYCNILRSSVLSMISATKQNEYVRQKKIVLILKTLLGICVLGIGFYLAVKEGGQEVMAYALAATVFVSFGVYLVFGGLIPFIFQTIADKKRLLYQKERCLWVNQMIFRMKKNYRTYAMVCVLALCSVTALAAGFAMKNRYNNMVQYRNVYTFQLLTNQENMEEQALALLEENNNILYSASIPVLMLDEESQLLPYSGVKRIADKTGITFSLQEPTEQELISVSHLTLLSLYTERAFGRKMVHGKSYQQIDETRLPYLGYLQEIMDFYIVNDEEFERLCSEGEKLYAYNYCLEDTGTFAETKASLSTLVSQTPENYTALVSIDPNDDDREWIKVLFSLCVFMFLVFILASASVMFMKLSNDAFEERERYLVMRKLGFEAETLGKAIAKELGTAYALPFLVMTVSAWFSVHALGKMMYENLFGVYIVSVLVVFVIFGGCYFLSITVYRRSALY